MIYLDASALITHITRRMYSAELRAFMSDHGADGMATSTVGFIETIRGVDRIGSFPDLMPSLLREYAELFLTPEIRDAAAHLTNRIRSLDAIHIASAQALGERLTALVTYDKAMADVAGTLGLPVVMPGMA